MWSMQDDCKAQSVKHGLSSEEKKIYTYLIYLSILAVIYDLYDNIEKCYRFTARQLRSYMPIAIILIIYDLQVRL